jgi:hypothetical protein
MRSSFRILFWQLFIVSLVAIPTSTSHAQKSAEPVIVAHDVIDGPTNGAHSVEVLTVLQDGTVTYSLQSKARKSFTIKLSSGDLSDLANLLNLQEIRELPKNMVAKIRSADFFWNQTLEIGRVDKMQSIQIEHFYPFLNLNGTVYPQKLIELECKLQDIKVSASKGQKDDGGWCKEILAHNFSESDSHKCSADEAQWQIEENHGWGPVQVSASLQSIEQAVGKGTPSETFLMCNLWSIGHAVSKSHSREPTMRFTRYISTTTSKAAVSSESSAGRWPKGSIGVQRSKMCVMPMAAHPQTSCKEIRADYSIRESTFGLKTASSYGWVYQDASCDHV